MRSFPDIRKQPRPSPLRVELDVLARAVGGIAVFDDELTEDTIEVDVLAITEP